MSKVYLDDTTLTGIANQTRRLTETQDTYTPSGMVEALSEIEIGGTNLNIFVQLSEPDIYWGIWIKSDSFEYDNIVEITNRTEVVGSSINIIKGNAHSTRIVDVFTYDFSNVYLTDSQNKIIRNIDMYYGDGTQWVQIPKIIELEYIENTGTKYLDTGIIGSNKIEADIVFEITSTTQWGCLFGSKNGENGEGYTCGVMSNYSVTAGWVGRSTTEQSYTGNSIMALNKKTTLESRETSITFKNESGTKTFSCTPASQTYNTGTYGLMLFANQAGTRIKDYTRAKLYSCIIRDNGQLVRYLIPAKDSNNEVCLYDDITGQYLYGAGNGTFNAGPVIE